ncbi:MAG: hypothetical protein HYZ49_06390, partial [Chloroflexi bacterium]|nr:hypothetical protein [Chloroflexota bacterium]
MKPESKFDRLKRYLEKLALPVLILPALAVTAASLFALITTVVYVAAESQPSDLLFPLRQPALQLQSMLTTDPGERTEIEIRLQAALPAASVSHPLIQPTLALAQAQTVNIASVGPLPSSTSESAASPASSGSIASSPSNTLAPNDAAESQPTRPATLSYTPTSSREAASPTTQPSNTSQPTATKQAASPTPTATSTSLPANTATPQPTATKQAASPTSTATSTSLPANTATSQPTATKQAASPTSTATSTSLPANTATPQPTATSTQVFL